MCTREFAVAWGWASGQAAARVRVRPGPIWIGAEGRSSPDWNARMSNPNWGRARSNPDREHGWIKSETGKDCNKNKIRGDAVFYQRLLTALFLLGSNPPRLLPRLLPRSSRPWFLPRFLPRSVSRCGRSLCRDSMPLWQPALSRFGVCFLYSATRIVMELIA